MGCLKSTSLILSSILLIFTGFGYSNDVFAIEYLEGADVGVHAVDRQPPVDISKIRRSKSYKKAARQATKMVQQCFKKNFANIGQCYNQFVDKLSDKGRKGSELLDKRGQCKTKKCKKKITKALRKLEISILALSDALYGGSATGRLDRGLVANKKAYRKAYRSAQKKVKKLVRKCVKMKEPDKKQQCINNLNSRFVSLYDKLQPLMYCDSKKCRKESSRIVALIRALGEAMEKADMVQPDILTRHLWRGADVSLVDDTVIRAPEPDPGNGKQETVQAFQVVLESTGNEKIRVIRKFKKETNLGLKESTSFILDQLPLVIKRNLSKSDADKLKNEYTALDATVTVEPSKGKLEDLTPVEKAIAAKQKETGID